MLCCRLMGTLHIIFQRRHDLRSELLDGGLLEAICSVMASVTKPKPAETLSDGRVAFPISRIATTPPSDISPSRRGDEEGEVFGPAASRGHRLTVETEESEGADETGQYDQDRGQTLGRNDLIRAVEGFCQDITALHLCGYILRGRENAKGLALLRDILDTIEVRGAGPPACPLARLHFYYLNRLRSTRHLGCKNCKGYDGGHCNHLELIFY